MKYPWKVLLFSQHILFFIIFFFLVFFTQNFYLDFPELIWNMIFVIFLSFGIYYLVYYYLVPLFYLSNKYPEFILYALICFLVSTLLRILVEPQIFKMNFNEVLSNKKFIYNVYTTQGIVILVATFLGITKDKFLKEQDLKELGEEKDQMYIDLLKSKLSPHFLLNTLNNIYVNSFVSSDKTSNSILQLSKLLQYIIYDSGKEKITVNQEFSSIKSLAELYQLKYNNQLNIIFEIENTDVWDVIEIPPSVFLTLFENSLKHSSIGIADKSFVKLSCKLQDYEMILEIDNSVAENKNFTLDEAYHGLGNVAIKGILDKFYPKRYNLFSGNQADEKYKTILKIKYYE
ncbi:sensor histidine kinase [Chryseobacterium sp. GP-SGM7]|uniref:sensor histidine kinase n=1 Tax=Chryseobacterium sp. GP-SGM7 TaxID=3411323 RepID=UPI003B9301DE